MTDKTIRKFNAIKACISLLDEAGVNRVEFHLDCLQDEEVEQIATDNKTVLYKPSFISPTFWTVIHIEKHRIHVSGFEHDIQFIKKVS